MTVGVKLLVPSALSFLLTCLGPLSAQEVGIGTGVLCNTAEQTARYVALLESDAGQALNKVNSENEGRPCTMARVAFIRGKEVARTRAKDSAVAIVEIQVVGIVTPLGIDRIAPLPQFTLFSVEEQRA
jgi:hypothetical protein